MTDRELMQQALDLLDDINQCSLPPTGIPLPAEIDHVMEALRARLAQPEPEPIGWIYEDDEGRITFSQTEQHPPFWEPVYRAKKAWQGLTDEEIEKIHYDIKCKGMGAYSTNDIYRAIEAKLKEKNA